MTDNHHNSDDVYWREGGTNAAKYMRVSDTMATVWVTTTLQAYTAFWKSICILLSCTAPRNTVQFRQKIRQHNATQPKGMPTLHLKITIYWRKILC